MTHDQQQGKAQTAKRSALEPLQVTALLVLDDTTGYSDTATGVKTSTPLWLVLWLSLWAAECGSRAISLH